MDASAQPPTKESAGFQILKHRLLLRSLNEIPEAERHADIIEEANQAAVMASHTSCPQLVFPCLFEERARAACEYAALRSRTYWLGMEAPESPAVHWADAANHTGT